MGTSNSKAIERWHQVCIGNKDNHLVGNSVFARADNLYSYGTHFVLAQPLRDKDNVVTAWLLNGDNYSVSTSRHQAIVRSELKDSEYPTIIVPFSALGAANIDRGSIQILDVQEDKTKYILDNVCDDPHPFHYGYVDHDDRDKFVTVYSTNSNVCHVSGQHCPGNVRHYIARHFLGASVFRAETCDPSYRDINGDIVYPEKRWAHFISAFDENERRPLYFLSELPSDFDGSTYEDALEALKPQRVKDADRDCGKYYRQGDIFAIETPWTDKELVDAGYNIVRRYDDSSKTRLLGTNHEATRVAISDDNEGAVYAQGCLYHNPGGRERDHARVKLTPKVWHLIVKNTVPMSNGSFSKVGGLVGVVRQSHSSRSWSMGGRVD